MVGSGAGPVVTIGLISGLLSSGTMMAYNGKRTMDTSEKGKKMSGSGPPKVGT